MSIVNIHEAKTHLSRLLERASKGETIVIAKAGKPVAKIGPLAAPSGQERLGFLRGQFQVPDDFDAMDSEDIADLFGS
jgi:prevent-host-death family protein